MPDARSSGDDPSGHDQDHDSGFWRVDLEVDVTTVVGGPESTVLRGWAAGPNARADGPTLVAYCLAGGGCSTSYFDLQVPGLVGYSMAEHLARRGVVVVAVDHLGVGSSDAHDLFAVTPTLLAACHSAAVGTIIERIECGELPPGGPAIGDPFVIGIGHSMGAMLTGVVQARHRPYDALVLLGHGGIGMPEVLSPEELAVSGPDLESIEDDLVRLARARFGSGSTVERRRPSRGTFFTESVPDEVRAAFRMAAVPLLPVCGLTSMVPHSAHHEKASIDVPAFLAFGDHDLIDDYVGTVTQFPAVEDLALFVLRDSGHCHNQATYRAVLWDRFVAWVRDASRTPWSRASR